MELTSDRRQRGARIERVRNLDAGDRYPGRLEAEVHLVGVQHAARQQAGSGQQREAECDL